MKKIKWSSKSILSMTLAATMVLQGAPLNVFASAGDPAYMTVLEDDVKLIDGQPTGKEANKHYYGGTYADGTAAPAANDGRLSIAESYGNSKTTAYKFGWITYGSGGSFTGWKFDFNGLPDQYDENVEPTAENEEPFYISDKINHGNMSITYPSSNPQGFNTTVGFGVGNTNSASISNGPSNITVEGALQTLQLGTKQALRKNSSLGTSFYPSKDGEWRNGEVVKVYDGTTDLGLEVRLSVKPSSDGKYVLTEYTVHNSNTDTDSTNAKLVDANRRTSAGGDGGRTVWFSAGTDIMIAGHDGAPVWSTPKTGTGSKIEGIHGQSNDGSTNTLASFDLLTYHPQMNLGIQKRDNTDPSKLTTWVGHYNSFTSNLYHDLNDISYMPNGTYSSLDSGLAYSMRFDLLPGETKTGTFAWSMKGPTYYVDPVNGSDSGAGNGHMGTPFKTIQKALDTIKSRSPKRVYIYVMGDTEVSNTLVVPAGKDITISTADYKKSSTTGSKTEAFDIALDANNVRSNQVTIKRAAGFNGDLFRLTKDSSRTDEENKKTVLRLTDIKLDGNKENAAQNTGALVDVRVGTLDLQTGSILTNNEIHKIPETFTDANGNGKWDSGEAFTDTNGNGKWDDFAYAASAVEVSDAGSFKMSTGGVIRGNVAYQGAAVVKDSSGVFNIGEGDSAYIFTIDDNLNSTGKPANVQLNVVKDAAGTVSGESNKIIATGNFADDSRIGIGTVKPPVSQSIAVPVVEHATVSGDVPYTVTNFPVDKRPGQWSTVVARDFIELSAAEYTYKVEYVRDDNGATLSPAQNGSYVVGTQVSARPVDLTANGYILSSTSIIPTDPAVHGLSVDAQGNIDGYMPSDNLSITYKYIKNAGVAKFFPNGGIASATEIVSTAGLPPTSSLPTATRTGYVFDGWYEMTDVNNNGDYDEGVDTVAATRTTALDNPVVLGTKYYVAKWQVSPDSYVFTIKHMNNNSALPLTFTQNSNSYRYTDAINASLLNIPGYKRLAQSANPRSAGAFDSNFNFSGTMPIGSVNVDYKYRVDTSQRFNFKIEHVDASGRDIQPATTVSRTAETPIVAAPINSLGYRLSANNITYPGTVPAGVPADVIKTVPEMIGQPIGQESAAFDANGNFSAYMPNQDVVLRYVYAPTSDYYVVQKYVDADDNNKRVGNVVPNPFNIGDSVILSFIGKYGYTFRSASMDKQAQVGGNFDASGNFNGGTMIADNVNITYEMNRNPLFWKTITYAVAGAPYDKGNVSGTTTFSFLKNDGSAEGQASAYTFGKIKELDGVATTAPNPSPYYKFDGWYLDSAATQPVTDDMTFANDVTVYAKFVEDPAYWADINFEAKEHGQIGTPTSLHTYYDNTWGNILTELPATTPEVNYLFDKWTDGTNPMENSTGIENNKTYYATFKKDPAIWGTELGHFVPVGSVDQNGKGKIKVNGVYGDNVYVVTDLDGNIVDVIKAPSDGTVDFTNLYPGTRYNVYEGGPETAAAPGNNIATVPNLSAPKEVLVPALGNNHAVGYDPENEGKVKIIVDPADPDSDYALIDENGNVVPYPDSDNGWKHANDPSNPKVVFDNLDPNATYTVVARKKGDTTKTPQDKLPEGSEVIANPGDEFEVPKYIVETKGGIVDSVAGTSIGNDRYTDAKRGDSVTIHADSTDSNGNAFKYWRVMNGHNSAINGNIYQNDFTFTMEATNIVLKAVYDRRRATPSNATVEEETRGAGQGEIALDPNSIESLENDLTTDKDRELISVNGADVRYKVVFDKHDASSADKALVRAASTAGIDHADAFTAAWALDIYADRYVDGRKVDRATASDAEVNTVIQLNSKDIDMLDYQIFDVTTGSVVEITPTQNPEDTAGLFEFTGNINHRYVLVYSKAFKITFVDNTPVLDHLHLNDLSRNFYKRFKIRRNESVSDSYYSADYGTVTAYAHGDTAGNLQTPFEDIYGTQYDYVNWSTKEMPLSIREFDENSGIKRNTVVYAYYNNNRPKVQKARVDLTDLVAEAETFTDNPFIKISNLNDLKDAIANAKTVLAMQRDDDAGNLRQANYAELKAAYDLLRAILDANRNAADNSRRSYIDRTGGNSSGGGGSVGKGKGTKERPLEGTPEKTFTLGVNGTWKVNPLTGKYQYLIYGGMPLNNTWGKILHTDVNGKPATDWYFFDSQSNMVTGWYLEQRTNKWYYLNEEAGKNNGKMLTGWFRSPVSGKMYYLDDVTGEMYRGWHLIGNKWYYFATSNTADGRPDGSLYTNTITPDGYKVDVNGVWIQ